MIVPIAKGICGNFTDLREAKFECVLRECAGAWSKSARVAVDTRRNKSDGRRAGAMRETLVIGVGNILLTDDGAGICAMRQLRDSKPALANTQFLDAGTLNFMLSTEIERADNLIIFDAADLGEEPGAVQCFLNEELDDFLCSGSRSAHEIGIADLMDFARLLDRIPSNRALIGLQPEIIDWGEWLSESVEAAIPEAVSLARRLINEWNLPSRWRAARWVGPDHARA